MMLFRRIFLLSLMFSLSASLQADQHGSHSEVNIEDFGFLAGYWQGEGFGGVSEEMWIPPSGGRMFGIFKQSNDDALVFSEYMEIIEADGQFVLRLKHFNPDFSGWEERNDFVTFPLESVSAGKAVFSGLSYELVEADQLRIEVNLRQSDGNLSTEVFTLARKAL